MVEITITIKMMLMVMSMTSTMQVMRETISDNSDDADHAKADDGCGEDDAANDGDGDGDDGNDNGDGNPDGLHNYGSDVAELLGMTVTMPRPAEA